VTAAAHPGDNTMLNIPTGNYPDALIRGADCWPSHRARRRDRKRRDRKRRQREDHRTRQHRTDEHDHRGVIWWTQ